MTASEWGIFLKGKPLGDWVENLPFVLYDFQDQEKDYLKLEKTFAAYRSVYIVFEASVEELEEKIAEYKAIIAYLEGLKNA